VTGYNVLNFGVLQSTIFPLAISAKGGILKDSETLAIRGVDSYNLFFYISPE
jgi:hypothetical protein